MRPRLTAAAQPLRSMFQSPSGSRNGPGGVLARTPEGLLAAPLVHTEEHAMQMNTLQDLMVENLKDLYSAENQILKAGPKMLKAVESEELKTALQEHLELTRDHVDRLKQIFEKLGKKPTGHHCKGMEGLLTENKELLEEDAEAEVLAAGLIVGQQKVEHYEIAGYGSAVTFAKLLGNKEAAELLAQTLDEEEKADKKLTQIAKKTINIEAVKPN
jgi:ferritin-like metal-binding protein YciE